MMATIQNITSIHMVPRETLHLEHFRRWPSETREKPQQRWGNTVGVLGCTASGKLNSQQNEIDKQPLAKDHDSNGFIMAN